MGLVRINPVISTTALTCVTTVGSNTVTSSAQFGSVVAGQRISGAGIPFNSVVGAVASTSSLTMINGVDGSAAPATATSASVSLRFGYFTSLQYSSADALGYPFAVPLTKINNVLIIDGAKQLTKCKLYFFISPISEIADNAAWAQSAADMAKCIGYIALATSITLTNAYIVTQATTALPVVLGANVPVWCQLVVDTDTPTFTAVDNITVVMTGE
jgi:hypothetical protein